MQRLPTGYVANFNRRHRRSGRLFQNRYKSILCQEDAYLLELVRYIHLNPVRAKLVSDPKSLTRYRYSGHGSIMGKRPAALWQDVDSILKWFGAERADAQKSYQRFVEKGLSQGRRPDLIGGGLIRSAGGWSAVKMMRKLKTHLKGDERILGDSDFVKAVLERAQEQMVQKYCYKAKGYDLDYAVSKAASAFEIPVEEVTSPGKQPMRVQARSVAAYWAVRVLSVNGTEVGRKLGIGQSAVSRAVKRGEGLVKELNLSLENQRNA
jgi:hypothetical protein